MKIRKAKRGDLKRIDEIYVEGGIEEVRLQFPKTSKKNALKDFDKHKENRLQGWRTNIKSSKHYWIVAVSGKDNIIGYGQAWVKRKDLGMVESVYVDKKYRKKGVGKLIMKDLIKWLKKQKIKNIDSKIYIKNKPSIKLHENMGFKPIAVGMRLK